MQKIVFNIAAYITPALLAMTILGKVSAFMIFALMLVLLCFMSRKEAGISFALVMPAIFGSIFNILGVGIPGSIIGLIIAILLLRHELIFIKKRLSIIIYICAIIFITLLSLLYGGFSSDGTKKMIDLLITTASAIIAFYPLAMAKDFDVSRISILYLIAGILFIAIAFDYCAYTKTYNLFDFESFRTSSSYNAKLGLPYVVYHTPGMIGCYTIAFHLSGKKKIAGLKDIAILVTSLWLILVSGTRQAMFCYFFIIACWTMIKSNKLRMKNIILSTILCVVGYIFLSMLEIESIQKIFDMTSTAEERLNRGYDFAFKTIRENFTFGVGFGNFNDPMTGQRYPHNIILEVLCEMGICGFLLMLIVLILFFTRNKFVFFKRTINDNYVLIIFIPYFIRSMISDDFSHNIILFVIIFTLFSNGQKRNVKYEQNITYSYC